MKNTKHQTPQLAFTLLSPMLLCSFSHIDKDKTKLSPSPQSKNTICSTINVENLIDCIVEAEVIYIDPSTGTLNTNVFLSTATMISPLCPPSCSPTPTAIITSNTTFQLDAGNTISPLIADISDAGSATPNFETAVRILRVGGVSVSTTPFCYSTNPIVLVPGTGSCSSTGGFKVEYMGGCNFKFSEQ